jgi:hypothetical protein
MNMHNAKGKQHYRTIGLSEKKVSSDKRTQYFDGVSSIEQFLWMFFKKM